MSISVTQEPNERRILVDGSMARGGGGYTYLVNIVPRLSRMAPNDRFQVLVRNPRLVDALAGYENVEVVLLPEAGLLERFRFLHLDAPKLAKEWGAHLYFSVGEYAPLRMSCPVIAAFRNPNVFTSMDQGWPLYQRIRLRVLRGLSWLSTKRADRIMFVSQDSADWIGDAMGLTQKARMVVHHGIDADRWQVGEDIGDPATRDGVILSVSSVYRYKNFVRLIEAYAQLARRDQNVPDLVIVGDNQDPEYQDKMVAAREAACEVAERIHLVGEVPYEEIKRYYTSASLFVFPSYLETFGHPMLEALSSDLPVVAADIPVFREIAGPAAVYADPYKVEALSSAMEAALTEPRLRERLVQHGRERVAHFSWDRSATTLLAEFRGLIQEQHEVSVPVRSRMIHRLASATGVAALLTIFRP